MNTWSDQISGNRGRQERRDFSENPDIWKNIVSLNYIYTKKNMKVSNFCLCIMLFVEMKRRKEEGKKLSNSWNLSCLTFSHITLHISTKPQTKIKSTVPSFLTDNIEIINKLYTKHCEENVQNQTISDTQRDRLYLCMLCWLSCC